MESDSSESLQNFIPEVLDRRYRGRPQGVQRRQSLSSVNSNVSKVTSILSSVSRSNQDLYPGLSQSEIELQRTATRNTIVSTLAERAQGFVGESDAESLRDTDGIGLIYRDQTNENALPTLNEGYEFNEIDPELITWDSDDDPANPRNWSFKKKWSMTAIVSLYTLMAPFSSSMISPAALEVSLSFGITEPTVEALLVSIFLLGLLAGPLLTGPISEMYGRRHVSNISIWIMFFFNLGCSLSQTTAQMCVFRFFAGLFGSAPLSIGAGCLGDMFTDRERNNAIAIYSLGPTVGPNVSPIIASFMMSNKSLNWRWPLYVLCMFNGVLALFGTLLLQETYAPQILYAKLKKLRKETGNENLHTIYEVADGETITGKFYLNITRPIVLLATHPMVFGLGSFMALVYGCLYLLIVTFPSTFINTYGFSIGISGLMFVSLLIGYMLGLLFFTWGMERSYPRLIAKNNGVLKPEFRLPFLIISGITTPVGLLWYGWSVDQKVHWIMPLIGACIFSFGIIAVFQTIQNYLIDMNPRFAASSIAAGAFFRSMVGFLFPLFITQMIHNLGFGWTYTLFAILGLAFGIPFPLFVVYRGEKLRLWANRRIERKQAKRDAKNLARVQRKMDKQMVSEERVKIDEKGSSSNATA